MGYVTNTLFWGGTRLGGELAELMGLGLIIDPPPLGNLPAFLCA